jgi:UDP-N-acetyl-D-glucosamine dehydrogenase
VDDKSSSKLENDQEVNLENQREIVETKYASVVRGNESGTKTKEFIFAQKLLIDRSANIGVIGLGYVGLPLAVTFNDAGYRVFGFEKSQEKTDFLNDGVSYIQDVPTKQVKEHVQNKKLSASTDFSGLKNCDVVIICVPTPLAKSQDPDLSYIIAATESVAANMKLGQLIVLESTTYPGTTREVMLPHLEAGIKKLTGRNGKVGEDFFLAFSPERVDPGNAKFNTFNTPKVVGGATPACGDLAALLYSQMLQKVIRVSSPEAAEMVKILENTFRAVNIGLVNEIAIICEKLGLDVWEIIEAAATKPFGFMPFYPGPGLGGHCIPIDPSYLSWKMRSLNYQTRFIELATSINRSMPAFCVDKVASALNLDKKALNGSRILVMGVAYKKDIDDMRESPSVDIIHLLEQRGATVDYYDPHVPEMHYEGLNMKSVGWADDLGGQYDCVVISTDHSSVNYRALFLSAKRIVDTRNALRDFKSDKIVKL